MVICPEWFDSLPKPEGNLANIQKAGRNLLKEYGMRTNRLEEWRRTDIKRLEKA